MSQEGAVKKQPARHLERAAAWRLLSQIFTYPDAGWAHRLELLCGCLREEKLVPLARRAAGEATPELWVRLFGPGRPVRIRSVSWEGGLQPGYLLAELAAFYEAFGYLAPAGSAPDDLSVLLDFAAWLELKLAYAGVRQDREAIEVTARALENFLSRFVSTVAWRVFRQLEGLGPEFLVEAARLAAERSGSEPGAAARQPHPWPDGSALDDLCCGGPVPLPVTEPGRIQPEDVPAQAPEFNPVAANSARGKQHEPVGACPRQSRQLSNAPRRTWNHISPAAALPRGLRLRPRRRAELARRRGRGRPRHSVPERTLRF